VVLAIAVVMVGSIYWFLPMASPLVFNASWLPEWMQIGAVTWRALLLSGLAVVVVICAPFWGMANDVAKRLIIARVLLLFVAVAAASLASTRPSDILAMVGWAFSLAMAGNFPALVMGIWWKRTTTAGAICGIIAGWSICLFYLVTTRYFPQMGVTYFGMSSLLNPETGQPLINVAQVMADARWIADVPASAANPMANRVGWFDLNNINCGLLGLPLGFLVIYVVSLFTQAPSKEMQAFIDEIRKPRGQTVLEEKV
jgi:cation/acetate symporter